MAHTALNRFIARLQGEVPADTLEAYRRAGEQVYDLLDQIELRRLECHADGLNPWTVPSATQAEMLCTWNAFALQMLGDRFLQADYDCDPATVGFVPPITADQVLAYYSQVEGWVTRAQQAHVNLHYTLDVSLPASLPGWSEVEPCPHSHLYAMLEAMRSLRDHAQAAIIFLPDIDTITDPTEQTQAQYIHQLLAAAKSKARYADDLYGENPSQGVYKRVEPYIKEAIEYFYCLGQLIAMPSLAEQAVKRAGVAPLEPADKPRRTLVLPGQSGFDPWCLTDPDKRAEFRQDPLACKAIDELWNLDPDPERTLQIQKKIGRAVGRGSIAYARDSSGHRLGHFFCCPWSPVYITQRPILLGGQRLRSLQQFVYDVTAEGVHLGEPFRRHIKTGVFYETEAFEYGDPNEPSDH